METQVERQPVPALRAIVGMLTNPGATFAAFPTKQPWFAPLLLFCLIGAVAAGLVASAVLELLGPQVAETFQEVGLPAGDTDNVVRVVRWMGLVVGCVTGFFGPVFQVFVTAVVVWVLALVLRQRMPFAQLFSLATYAYVPHVFFTLLFTALVVSGVYDVIAMQSIPPTSLGALFADVESAFFRALLTRIELFSLWSTVLLGLGLTAAAHRASTWGFGVAFAAWLLTALVSSAFSGLGPAPGNLPVGTVGGPGLDGGIPR